MTKLCFSILLAVLAAPSFAEERERPITFSSTVGVLGTGGILDLPSGTHALLVTSLDAQIHPRYGFFLDGSFMSRRQNIYGSRIPRFSTAGLLIRWPAGSVDVGYRVGYGVLFGVRRVSTLFVHGLWGAHRVGDRWRILLNARHLVPNDWFKDVEVSEELGSVAFSVGLGVEF